MESNNIKLKIQPLSCQSYSDSIYISSNDATIQNIQENNEEVINVIIENDIKNNNIKSNDIYYWIRYCTNLNEQICIFIQNNKIIVKYILKGNNWEKQNLASYSDVSIAEFINKVTLEKAYYKRISGVTIKEFGFRDYRKHVSIFDEYGKRIYIGCIKNLYEYPIIRCEKRKVNKKSNTTNGLSDNNGIHNNHSERFYLFDNSKDAPLIERFLYWFLYSRLDKKPAFLKYLPWTICPFIIFLIVGTIILYYDSNPSHDLYSFVKCFLLVSFFAFVCMLFLLHQSSIAIVACLSFSVLFLVYTILLMISCSHYVDEESFSHYYSLYKIMYDGIIIGIIVFYVCLLYCLYRFDLLTDIDLYDYTKLGDVFLAMYACIVSVCIIFSFYFYCDYLGNYPKIEYFWQLFFLYCDCIMHIVIADLLLYSNNIAVIGVWIGIIWGVVSEVIIQQLKPKTPSSHFDSVGYYTWIITPLSILVYILSKIKNSLPISHSSSV